MARIELLRVGKTFKGASAFSIRDLTLTIPDGQTTVILGPSGCGKTTLLKIIAGLIPPDSGRVRYDGRDMSDIPPGDRRVGMVFQSYALYPHLTSRRNVLSYFMFRKQTPQLDAMAKAKYQRTSELMGVELAYLLDRRPTTLSGGEKQRVALGRCITRDASLFLVDEPFANLDQALRERYRVNLKILLRQFDITTVYVTHDHHEALILADRLAIMNRGRIAQVGTFQDIYDSPDDVFVAGFLNVHVDCPALSLIDGRHLPERLGLARMQVGVRPEDVEVSGEERDGGIRGRVAQALHVPMMDTTVLTIHCGDQEVHARIAGRQPHRAGAHVWLTLKRYHVFDRESGRRLRSDPEERAPAARPLPER